ncbi:MAG: hypothetical protein WKF37_08925 [Bryobacteraceae bacterium]
MSDSALRGARLAIESLPGWSPGWLEGRRLETAQSGPVFTVVNVANTTMPSPLVRCGRICSAMLVPSNERTINRWFDTNAFAAPAQFTFGNSPRSGLRGASLLTTDVTIEKSFRLTEHWKFDLRGEFYNVFNKANFEPPGHVLGGPGFGVVSSADAARRVQLAARLSF